MTPPKHRLLLLFLNNNSSWILVSYFKLHFVKIVIKARLKLLPEQMSHEKMVPLHLLSAIN